MTVKPATNVTDALIGSYISIEYEDGKGGAGTVAGIYVRDGVQYVLVDYGYVFPLRGATVEVVIYECGICSCYHPWGWDGDCRDDANRIPSPEEYAEKIGVGANDVEVRSMEERIEADGRGE